MTKKYNFSGVWRSVHHKVDSRGTAIEVEYYVTLQQIGNQLIVSSIPDDSGSCMSARFTLENGVATGNYQSQTFSSNNPTSYYGAAMLMLDAEGNSFKGKGVGFGKDQKVKTTAWDIVRLSDQAALERVGQAQHVVSQEEKSIVQ